LKLELVPVVQIEVGAGEYHLPPGTGTTEARTGSGHSDRSRSQKIPFDPRTGTTSDHPQGGTRESKRAPLRGLKRKSPLPYPPSLWGMEMWKTF